MDHGHLIDHLHDIPRGTYVRIGFIGCDNYSSTKVSKDRSVSNKFNVPMTLVVQVLKDIYNYLLQVAGLQDEKQDQLKIKYKRFWDSESLMSTIL